MNKEEIKMLERDTDNMNYEEAISMLYFDLAMRTFDPNTGELATVSELRNSFNKENYGAYVAINKAIKSMEKNEIKKLKYLGHEVYYCPVCHRIFSDIELLRKMNYCYNCGQRISL